MIKHQNLITKNIIEWLLAEDNPSVRYFTLRDLLDKKEDEIAMKTAKSMIPNSKLVTKILSKQNPKGYWEELEKPYLPKYKASYWTLMLLGQLGIDRIDERVKKACEYIFRFQHEEGGFMSETKKTAKRQYDWYRKQDKKLPPFKEFAVSLIRERQLSCLTGNMVTALIRLGYSNDPRVKKALDWLKKIQNQDGGWLCPYWQAHIKDTHGCFFGTICPMEAFSEVPKENLTKGMKNTIKHGTEFLLMHHPYKSDHHDYKITKQSWLKFCFPRFYSYDILRGLNVLTKLGYIKDERLNDAVEIILKKHQKDGTWVLENSPTGRMHTNIETVGKPSKWITLIALRVLKRLNKLN